MDDKNGSVSTILGLYDEIFKNYRLPSVMKDLSYDSYKDNDKFKTLISYKKALKSTLSNLAKSDFSEKVLSAEFDILKKITDNDSDHYNNLIENTDNFDRYSDIRPYKYNHITLSDGSYINASRIHGFLPSQENMFIATQGPMEHTQKHFWKMIYENKVNLIVMLCKLKEGERDKCYRYWPDLEGVKKFDDLKIICEDESEIKKGLTKTKICVYKGDSKHEVTHLLYSLWPDHGVPSINAEDDVFEKIIGYVDSYFNIWDNNLLNPGFGPVAVHCSAGVGRTGTFISLYNVYSSLRYQQVWAEQNKGKFNGYLVNVFNEVRKVKEQRLISLENVLQYKFLNAHVLNMLKKLKY